METETEVGMGGRSLVSREGSRSIGWTRERAFGGAGWSGGEDKRRGGEIWSGCWGLGMGEGEVME